MSRIHLEGGVSVRVGYESLPKDLSSAEVARFFHPNVKVRDVIRSVRERGAQVALTVQAGAVRTIGRLLDHVDRVPLQVTQYVCEELCLRPNGARVLPPPYHPVEARAMALGCPRRPPVCLGGPGARPHGSRAWRARGARRGRPSRPGRGRSAARPRPPAAGAESPPPGPGMPRSGPRSRAPEARDTLDRNAKLRLHRLLEADPRGGPCDLLWLSHPPGDPRADNLEDLVARKKRLEELGLEFRSPLAVSDALRWYLVQRAQAYSPQALQQLPKETRYGLLVFRLREQYRRILDWILLPVALPRSMDFTLTFLYEKKYSDLSTSERSSDPWAGGASRLVNRIPAAPALT